MTDNAELKSVTKFISAVIRNNIEDFHVKHLSDEQMKELNPLIRDAVYTSLYYISESQKGDNKARHSTIPNNGRFYVADFTG